MTITSRLPDVGTSIFSVMSKMAADHGAINLSQGFPDFAIDANLVELVYKYMKEGNNQYAPMPGVLPLRQSIATIVQSAYKRKTDPEKEVTITAGATEALYSAIAAFIGAGDEVIVFDPSYDSYDPAIRLNGGVPIHLNLTFPDFAIDWKLVASSISAKTRMIIINTPHNPTGTILTPDDLRQLEKIAIENNLVVLSDEVYERLVFDGNEHQSVLRSAALANHAIAIFSFGKSLHATGWKCGYVVASEKLTAEIRKVHQFNVFSVNTPVQFAVSAYIDDTRHLNTLPSFYQQKRDFFLEAINGSSFEPLKTSGSYFQLLRYDHFSKEDDVTVAGELTRRFKLASIPVSVFYKDKTDNHILRFCFAKKEETLEQAATILRGI